MNQYLLPLQYDVRQKMKTVMNQMKSIYQQSYLITPTCVLRFSLSEKKENQVWLTAKNRDDYYLKKSLHVCMKYNFRICDIQYEMARENEYIIRRMMNSREKLAGKMINLYSNKNDFSLFRLVSLS